MIYELSDNNVLPLTQLDLKAKETNHGSIPVTLDISEGKIVGIQGVSFSNKRYKDDTTAIAEFVENLRQAVTSKVNGTFSGTFVLKEGRITEVVTQSGFKVVFKR